MRWKIKDGFKIVFCFVFYFLLIGAGSFYEVWRRSFDIVLMKIEATLGRFLSELFHSSFLRVRHHEETFSASVFRLKSRFFCLSLHCHLHLFFFLTMSGNSVTCIKATFVYYWLDLNIYDCSPVLWYHSTSLSVNLLWNSNVRIW